jgi:predicted nucleic acid-binding protein
VPPLLLDTSVLIDAHGAPAGDPNDPVAISVVTLTELHFGVLAAPDDKARSARLQVLANVERVFEPIPIEARVAREWGHLHAAVRARGGQPRRRVLDLALAATAKVHECVLVTHNIADFAIIDDLVDVRAA